jgi:hypothetical protein
MLIIKAGGTISGAIFLLNTLLIVCNPADAQIASCSKRSSTETEVLISIERSMVDVACSGRPVWLRFWVKLDRVKLGLGTSFAFRRGCEEETVVDFFGIDGE